MMYRFGKMFVGVESKVYRVPNDEARRNEKNNRRLHSGALPMIRKSLAYVNI